MLYTALMSGVLRSYVNIIDKFSKWNERTQLFDNKIIIIVIHIQR